MHRNSEDTAASPQPHPSLPAAPGEGLGEGKALAPSRAHVHKLHRQWGSVAGAHERKESSLSLCHQRGFLPLQHLRGTPSKIPSSPAGEGQRSRRCPCPGDRCSRVGCRGAAPALQGSRGHHQTRGKAKDQGINWSKSSLNLQAGN